MAEPGSDERKSNTRGPRDGPPVLGPTEARQGRIILGPTGRRIWLTVLILFILAVVAAGLTVLI